MGKTRKPKPKTPPCVMIGLELLEAIKVLSDEDVGRFMRAVLEYGAHSTEPHFGDDNLPLRMLWAMTKPKIDANAAHYDKSVLQRRYANYCKHQKELGKPAMDYTEWYEEFETEDEY